MANQKDQEEKKNLNKKKPPKGCSIGCLGFIVILLIGFIISQSTSKKDETKPKDIEGIEVKMNIDSNSVFLDEAIIEAEIKNTNEKAFSGNVSIFHSSFKAWWVEVEFLPPGKTLKSQTKVKYIKNPDDEYRYSAQGELIDSSYSSGIDFEVFETEVSSSFNVKTEYIDEDTAKRIIKQLYYEFGPLTYVGIYDKDQEMKDVEILPRAQYFGHVDQTISFHNEDDSSKTIDFNPSKD